MIKHVADPDWSNNYGCANDYQVPAESDYSYPTQNW